MEDPSAQVIVSLLESRGETKVFTIWTSDVADLQKLQAGVGSWRIPSLATLRGTVLGATDFMFYYPFEIVRSPASGQRAPIPRDQWRLLPMEDQFDALLYLGPPSTMTQARLPTTLCADRDYLKMRLGRLALLPAAVGPQNPGEQLKRYCTTEAPKEAAGLRF
jgi:hypothetical protein